MREDVTRGDIKKILKECARLNIRKNAFPLKLLNNWSSLLGWVVNAGSVAMFERKLDIHWDDQEQIFIVRHQKYPPPHTTTQ